jgi:hypothetical protein
MAKNAQGSWVGTQTQPTFQSYQTAGAAPGAPAPTSTPTTPGQTNTTQQPINFNTGSQPLYGNGGTVDTGRDQLVNAVMNATTPPGGMYASAETSDIYNPANYGHKYEPYVHVSNIWAGGNQPGWLFDPGRQHAGISDPSRFRPKASDGGYRRPGQQGRISTPFATMPDQYPEFRYDPAGVMGRR